LVALLAVAGACAESDRPSSSTFPVATVTVSPTLGVSPTVTASLTLPPRPTVTASPTIDPGSPASVRPEGFGTATVQIRRADGTLCELCTYLAGNGDERQLGLMGVTDLGGRDGMIFVFEAAGVHGFWMKNTVMPLSAAWFGPDGALVGTFDMAPCPATETNCPTYGPSAEALHVLEVPEGDLVRLGIGPGARLERVGEPCDPAAP
jgi:uncharacterized membrane protein (UPF0127 family)